MDIKKYSNQTKRDVAEYMIAKGIQSTDISQRTLMDLLEIYLSDKRLRTPEELEQDLFEKDRFERMSNGSYYTK